MKLVLPNFSFSLQQFSRIRLTFSGRNTERVASEDANVDMMERSEVVSSAGSGSHGLTLTENDDTLSEACSEEDTLNLVEGAILRTLKRYSSQPHDGSSPERHSENAKRVEGSRPRGRFNSVGDEEQLSAVSGNAPLARSSNPEDMELLANLLEQVHNLRRSQRQGSRGPKETLPTEVQDVLKPGRSFDRRRGKEKKSSSSSTEELRITLEAAAMAAKAAADAAEAAAESVARNTEAIDFIVKSMKSSKKRHKPKKATASDEKKAIVKSNQLTHWILGLMAVTTVVWRFGVVKVVKQVTSKLNDPLGYVGQLVGGNDEPSEEKPAEKSFEKGNLLERFSHVDLPSILPHDSDHKDTKSAAVKKGKETSENGKDGKETNLLTKSAAAVDVKTKEAGKQVEKTAFSFANLLQIKSKEN